MVSSNVSRWSVGFSLVASLLGAACAGSSTGHQDDAETDHDSQPETWNNANNPAFVDSSFIYEADKLPLLGTPANAPIPGDYWATYRDNINVRWDGETSMSAAEKFAKAFGKPGTPDAVSRNFGIKSRTDRKECSTSSDCSSLSDGSDCAIPNGETKGRCIPTWWGICHGWSPYAISEKQPTQPVTKNGVTFYPGDLEGLMSLVYSEHLTTKFLSGRCSKAESAIVTDGSGRIPEGECRDMNPGSFHIVMTNMLGIRKTGFVYDRTASDEVWNQPVAGYRITNAVGGKLKEITKTEAAKLLGLDVKLTPALASTVLAKSAMKSGTYTATRAGKLVIKMTGSGDADLHVKKGGEATATVYDCRPYAGSSDEECHVTVAVGDKVGWMALGYAETSTVSVAVGESAGDNVVYTYNTQATRFFEVETDFDYIHESSPRAPRTARRTTRPRITTTTSSRPTRMVASRAASGWARAARITRTSRGGRWESPRAPWPTGSSVTRS